MRAKKKKDEDAEVEAVTTMPDTMTTHGDDNPLPEDTRPNTGNDDAGGITEEN
jgi:hypothetical protein